MLVNDTESLAGVQIGLLNFNADGFIPVIPFINIGFGGSDVGEEETENDEE